MARNAAIFFVQRYSGLTNEEVGEIFGRIHYCSVSKTSSKFKGEMVDNKQISKLIGLLNSNFNAFYYDIPKK